MFGHSWIILDEQFLFDTALYDFVRAVFSFRLLFSLILLGWRLSTIQEAQESASGAGDAGIVATSHPKRKASLSSLNKLIKTSLQTNQINLSAVLFHLQKNFKENCREIKPHLGPSQASGKSTHFGCALYCLASLASLAFEYCGIFSLFATVCLYAANFVIFVARFLFRGWWLSWRTDVYISKFKNHFQMVDAIGFARKLLSQAGVEVHN